MTMTQLNWPALPTEPDLAADAVHLICVTLTQETATVDALRHILSPDEAERADRFHFERDRRRYTVARGTLRRILGRYLRIAPQDVRFDYGPQGKPSLSAELPTAPAILDLNFNVSHSHELAVIGVTRTRQLGVDVEHRHRTVEYEQIASHFFSAQEQAELSMLPPSQIAQGFFNCWTRKEAYIKAIGKGLSHPLDKFAVSLAPGQPARLLRVDPDPAEVDRWSLHAPDVHSEYITAIMAEGRDWSYEVWQAR